MTSAILTFKMQSPPQFPIRVIVRAVGPVVEGLCIGLDFEMKARNDFSTIVFLNADGFVQMSGEELLRDFYHERSESPMDYVDPQKGFTGHVRAHVNSQLELYAAIEAFRIFKKFFPYPVDYEKKLKAAAARGQNPDEYQLELSVEY